MEQTAALTATALIEPLPLATLLTTPATTAFPCQEQDGELWFAQDPADLEQAKAHCLDCPIRTDCLAGALERREPWGVWGGELFDAGRIVARKRPRGRPRKVDILAEAS